MQITDMPRASVSDDGTRIEMELGGPDGRVALAFSRYGLEQLLSRVAQLTQAARSRTATATSPPKIQALVVTAADAQAPAGGGQIFLRLVAATGQPYSFALPIVISQTLRTRMDEAERKAAVDGNQTRQ